VKTRLIIGCFLLYTSMIAVGQTDSTFRHVKTIKGDIIAFTVDNLDNIYLLNSTNQLKKLNAAGDSVAVYNAVKKFGVASLIDVSNPLKVLVYYRDFGTIVVLDRFLTIRNTIDLRKHNILQVKAIGQSYDNKIWLYDDMENKLKKIDDDGNLLQETPDFRQLFGSAPAPQKIFDQDQYVYIYDSTQDVLVFDYFGTFKNKIPIKRWNNFKVAGKYMFGSMGNVLYRYDIRTLRMDEWTMPEDIANAGKFNFTVARLYALRKNSIAIFDIR
jgi:hypothetical protein